MRHRDRFTDALASLTDEQWSATSRCDAWSNREVVCHLVDVDMYWTYSLESGRNGEPITYLRDFDPVATPQALVDSKTSLSTAEVFDAFTTNGATFRKAVESLGDNEWDALCEAPIGHVTARVMLAHTLWDSWLHERDILLGLGAVGDPEPDELAVVTWYSLLFGGAQGGVVDDEHAVGSLPTEPIDAQLQFDDLPDTPLRLAVDRVVYVGPADAPRASGSAVDFVEAVTGRSDPFPPVGVTWDEGFAAQLAHAREIL